MKAASSIIWSAIEGAPAAQLQCQCKCQCQEHQRAFIRLDLSEPQHLLRATGCRDMADPGRSPSRDRANGEEEKRRRSPDEPSRPDGDFKIFVGGISWHMNDRELKDSECWPQAPTLFDSCSTTQLVQADVAQLQLCAALQLERCAYVLCPTGHHDCVVGDPCHIRRPKAGRVMLAVPLVQRTAPSTGSALLQPACSPLDGAAGPTALTAWVTWSSTAAAKCTTSLIPSSPRQHSTQLQRMH